MAVLVLVPLISSAITGAGLTGASLLAANIGLAVLGAGAAYVDQTFIYPAIFKQKGNDGPRLDDVRVQAATEGSPMQFTIGTVRIGGTVIWASDLIEKKKKVGGGKSGSSNTYSYSVDIAIAFGRGERYITKLWANGKLIYDFNGGDPVYDVRYKEILLFPGDYTQGPSALIESHEGDTPAYRGVCYATIEGLELADFGNTIPQFTALLEQGDELVSVGIPLTEAVTTIMDHAGWDPDWYDVTKLPEDALLRGMVINGPTDLGKVLEPILLAYKVIVRETDGVLEFVHREETDTVEIPDEDFGFGEKQPKDPYRVEDKSTRLLPSEVNIRFLDPTNYYDDGMKTERSPLGLANNVMSIDFPMVLKPEEARSLAREFLWSGYAEGQAFTGTVPPTFMVAQEGDIIDRQVGARTRRVRVTELSRGWNTAMEFLGYFEQPNTQVGGTPTYDPAPPQPPPRKLTAPLLFILDIAPLQNAQVNIPGAYVCASRSPTTNSFDAVTVYMSSNDTDYEEVGRCVVEATMGEASVLDDIPAWGEGDPTPDPNPMLERDDVNELTVTLFSGDTLVTVTDSQCRNGKNWMLVGDEVIGFVEAELVSGSTYTLRKLYRGLMDTQHACSTHIADETAVLLDEALIFVPIPIGLRTLPVWWKGVPAYGNFDDYTGGDSVWYAENVKCFRPYQVEAQRDDDGNILIHWARDSRYPKPALINGGPLEEGTMAFQLSIYDSVGGSIIIRQHTVTIAGGTPIEFEYDVSMQEDDSMIVGDPIKIRLRQIGGLVALGRFVDVDNL